MAMRISKIICRLIEVAFGLVVLNAAAYHVLLGEFRPLVAMSVPLLVVFYGFASVLFVRGRAMAPGPWQTRSLYAAERAMQATVLYLLAIVLGAAVYTGLKHLAALHGAWLLFFILAFAPMQLALICFMRGVWALAPDLFRPASMRATARRVVAPPAPACPASALSHKPRRQGESTSGEAPRLSAAGQGYNPP